MDRIALLAAVWQELAPLARRLQRTHEPAPLLARCRAALGRIGSVEVLLIAGGMGARRAESAAEALLTTWPPDLLTVTGVAGALHPDLAVGDLIVVDSVLAEDEVLVTTPAHVATFAPGAPDVPLRQGSLLSLDRVLITAAEKHSAFHGEHPFPNTVPTDARLGEHRAANARKRPIAVEMETAAAARVAIRHGVPWTAVRAISDRADESLPLDFNRLRNADGDLPTARVARAALAHPAAIAGLIRLGRNTNAAAEALARFLFAWISYLGG